MTRRRMFRYVVPVDDQRHTFELNDSVSGGPLHVQAAGEVTVEFWAEASDAFPAIKRAFQVFGTGHNLPDDAIWVGTSQRTPGGFVWHLYEVNP